MVASIKHGRRHVGSDAIRPATLAQTGLLSASAARDIDGVAGVGFRQVWNLMTFTPTTIAGTWVRATNVNMLYAGQCYNSSNADLDEFNIAFRCPAGTYRLRYNARKQSNMAILDVTIDVTLIASTDMYAAAVDYLNVNEHTGIVLTAGAHTLKFKANGRNVAATAWYVSPAQIVLDRTA